MINEISASSAAINFALDDAEGNGLIFLSMWREGDWEGIKRYYPKFDLTTAQVEDSIVKAKIKDEYLDMPSDDLLKILNATRFTSSPNK